MQFIDTHTHLYAADFDADREAMLERAKAAGLIRLYLPNIERSSIASMLALEAAHPEFCSAQMGLHPCSVGADYEEELAEIERQWALRRFSAVGEIGLDYYWSMEFEEQQRDAFRRQLGLAKRLNVPVVIHARDSLDDCIAIVREEKTDAMRGIFHCFSGNAQQARACTDLDFLLGIGGVLTYKKSGLDAAIADVPLSSLVLETDSPYLAPTPYRGKRNESAYIVQVAQHLALLRGITLGEVAEVTSANALALYEA